MLVARLLMLVPNKTGSADEADSLSALKRNYSTPPPNILPKELLPTGILAYSGKYFSCHMDPQDACTFRAGHVCGIHFSCSHVCLA